MRYIILMLILIVSAQAQFFLPLQFKQFDDGLYDTLSVFQKNNGKFYHIWNLTQSAELNLNGEDTTLVRIQKYKAIGSDLAFDYEVVLSRKLKPNIVKFVSTDSIETHIFNENEIYSVTNYLTSSKSDYTRKLNNTDIVFDDIALDIALGHLSIKQNQAVKVPIFSTDDGVIKRVTITFQGFFQLPIDKTTYNAKQFKIQGPDFTDFYWLSVENNALLQYESIDYNYIMIRQNFNKRFK